jgi:hypothetical protein
VDTSVRVSTGEVTSEWERIAPVERPHIETGWVQQQIHVGVVVVLDESRGIDAQMLEHAPEAAVGQRDAVITLQRNIRDFAKCALYQGLGVRSGHGNSHVHDESVAHARHPVQHETGKSLTHAARSHDHDVNSETSRICAGIQLSKEFEDRVLYLEIPARLARIRLDGQFLHDGDTPETVRLEGLFWTFEHPLSIFVVLDKTLGNNSVWFSNQA